LIDSSLKPARKYGPLRGNRLARGMIH